LLHYAAPEGDLDRLCALITAGANPNLADWAAGFTALQFAAQAQHAEIVRALPAAGAAVDPLDHLDRTPPAIALHHAGRGAGEVIAALLEYGAYADRADARGITPRHLTESVDSYALRRFLRALMGHSHGDRDPPLPR
jgi:ankyrin repeat protein